MSPNVDIDSIIEDLCRRQTELSNMLAQESDPELLIRLFAVHGANASRLGQLLRTRQALSSAADSITDVIQAAIHELESTSGYRTEGCGYGPEMGH